MTSSGTFLVVGGDSLVGGGLLAALERRGHAPRATTRRRDTVSDGRVYLDFDSEEVFRVPPGADYAFVVAAATNYERCETDPRAFHVNVERIPRVVGSMLEQGVFVTFVSTNSVFGGERPWPREEDPHAPGIAYAKQKHLAEDAIRSAARRLGAEDRLAIVRLTKILGPETSPLPAWRAAWKEGQPVHPFADLIFAPLSVPFVGDALAVIGEKRVPGPLHVSGAENVSYVDFAYRLAERLGVPRRLVVPTTAAEKGVHIAFKPRYSGLAMARTTPLTGLRPQTLDEVVADLAESRP